MAYKGQLTVRETLIQLGADKVSSMTLADIKSACNVTSDGRIKPILAELGFSYVAGLSGNKVTHSEKAAKPIPTNPKQTTTIGISHGFKLRWLRAQLMGAPSLFRFKSSDVWLGTDGMEQVTGDSELDPAASEWLQQLLDAAHGGDASGKDRVGRIRSDLSAQEWQANLSAMRCEDEGMRQARLANLRIRDEQIRNALNALAADGYTVLKIRTPCYAVQAMPELLDQLSAKLANGMVDTSVAAGESLATRFVKFNPNSIHFTAEIDSKIEQKRRDEEKKRMMDERRQAEEKASALETALAKERADKEALEARLARLEALLNPPSKPATKPAKSNGTRPQA